MSKSWPPSPSVEDEIASLAREHGSDDFKTPNEHGTPPAGSRGVVDQYPIIQDVTAKAEPQRQQERAHRQSVHQPVHTVPKGSAVSNRQEEIHNDERRYVFVHGHSTDATLKPDENLRPRSKSTTRIDGDETPRGRPQVTRIHTDFGKHDLHPMATGERRAPSPYAYKPSPSASQIPIEGKPKASLLSPETAAASRSADLGTRRARSAHPDRSSIAVESSDSDHKTSYRRHRSKSRVAPSHPDKDAHIASADERHSSGRKERHRSTYRRSDQSPARDQLSDRSHRSAHGDITPPQTPSLPRESPYASAAEDSDRRRRDKSRPRYPDRRYSKDSPYATAAEDSYKRWSGDSRDVGTGSRRGSVKRPEKPQIDLGDSRASGRFDSNTPMSARTPKAMEDYFQHALDQNHKKHTRYTSVRSVQPSPFSSPPTSPPRTPRGERRPRDYFELNAPLTAPPKQRSRGPSVDENPLKPLTTLLSSAIGGSLASKAIPGLSRSSTTSLETPSSGSQSSLPSGQRSRKPSPVHGEPRPVSRAGSLISKEDQNHRIHLAQSQQDRPVSRAGSVASREENMPPRTSTYPPQSDRPVSRAGSINESYSARASAFANYDERPSSRSGSYATGLTPQPPPTHRASSYSAPYDQARARPNSRRTYSSNNGAIVTPASSQSFHPRSNLSQSYMSPVSSNDVPLSATPAPVKTITFPKCPRELPVAGFNNWYTIRGMQNFDICNTCMQVLGASSFRDYCIPSPYRPPNQAVACLLSRPWIRIAIARCLQDGDANIPLLQNLNRLPTDVWPCPGKNSDVRKWYHVLDRTTKMPISNFDVCTACVRSVELIFPELQQEKLLERPVDKLSQERVCNLNTNSKHFYSILNELDRLAGYSKKKDLRPKDISNFADFVKKKTRYRECSKDSRLATPLWHFIPRLPEFTICEECFEEIVWPLKDKPIAREVLKTVQKVPTYRPDHHIPGISCQLYSQRMRKVFADAVARNDFETLRYEAQLRFNVEGRLQEKQMILAQDLKAGIDRRADMERNSGIWKSYE